MCLSPQCSQSTILCLTKLSVSICELLNYMNINECTLLALLPATNLLFSELVPAPRHLTLERQLNKSVLIGWTSPEPPGYNQIESYHVYVDGVLKVTVKANERTRALVEGVDCNRVSGEISNLGIR